MSINVLSEVVEITEKLGGIEVRRVPLGTFAGTQFRLFVVPVGESAFWTQVIREGAKTEPLFGRDEQCQRVSDKSRRASPGA